MNKEIHEIVHLFVYTVAHIAVLVMSLNWS